MSLPKKEGEEKVKKITALGFPLVVNIINSVDVGEGKFKSTQYTMRLVAINKNPFKEEWEEPSIEDDNNLVSAYEGVYEPIGDVNRGLFSLMGVNLEETINFMDNYEYTPIEKSGKKDSYISEEELSNAEDYMKAINDAEKEKSMAAIKAAGKTYEQVVAENKAKHGSGGLLKFGNLNKDENDKEDCNT